MKDPDRLLEWSDSEVARLLVRAGHEDAPMGAKQRALAAATGVLAASTLTAGNATGAALAGKAAVGAKAATLVSLKWMVVAGVASVGVAAGTAAVHVVRAGRVAPVAVEAATTAPATAHGARAPLSAPAPSPAVTSSVAPTSDPSAIALPAPPPAPPPASVAARAATSPVRSSPSAGSTSSAELVMLDQARSAMDGGDPARALTVLDAYAARFPRGVMAPEASILRIQALVSSGNRPAARRAADAFLRANPTSPYAPRIESLLGPSNP